MYLLLTVLPIIFLLILVIFMVGFFWASFEDNNFKLAIMFFVVSLAMVIPMLVSAQQSQAHTEENLVITESGRVTEVITNVHSVDRRDGGIITYTDRNGQVGEIVTSIDRRVDVQNAHLYKK